MAKFTFDGVTGCSNNRYATLPIEMAGLKSGGGMLFVWNFWAVTWNSQTDYDRPGLDPTMIHGCEKLSHWELSWTRSIVQYQVYTISHWLVIVNFVIYWSFSNQIESKVYHFRSTRLWKDIKMKKRGSNETKRLHSTFSRRLCSRLDFLLISNLISFFLWLWLSSYLWYFSLPFSSILFLVVRDLPSLVWCFFVFDQDFHFAFVPWFSLFFPLLLPNTSLNFSFKFHSKNLPRQKLSLSLSENLLPIHVFQVDDTVGQGMKSPIDETLKVRTPRPALFFTSMLTCTSITPIY